jgi:tetratricopeptide (TPR) repeat protein
VTKDELIAEVWQHEDASDATIVQHVWMVRKLLGEHAKSHKYILTVSKKGYRFIPHASHAPDEGIEPASSAAGEVSQSAEPAVWREFLLAIHYAGKRDYSGLKLALQHFNAALTLDSTFAPAWLGIAGVYSNIAFYAFDTWERVLAPATAAITRAIELDRNSALAHCVRAQIQLAQWNISESERSLDRAGSVDPQSPAVYQLSSFVHAWRGESELAVADAKRALAIGPSDVALHGTFANALACSGDYENAIASYSEILELDASCRIPRQGRCEAYIANDQLDLALRDLEQLPRTCPNVSRLACAYAFLGDDAKATRLLVELQGRSSKEYVEPHCFAQTYIALGRYDEAIGLTQMAIANNDLGFPGMLNSPLLHRRMKDKRVRQTLGDIRKFLLQGSVQ